MAGKRPAPTRSRPRSRTLPRVSVAPRRANLREAYGRFVPHRFLELLGRKDITEVHLGDHIETTLTILFSDIRNFTTLSESMSPRENFEFLNSYLRQMEPVIGRHNGVIDKYIGDAIMALFPTGADDAVQGAVAMLEALADYCRERQQAGHEPVRIGIGLNTGLTMLGTIGGLNRMEGTVISDAVNVAARLESMTKHYGISLLIGEPTYHSLANPAGHDARFVDRVLLKGKLRPQSVYEVFDADPPALREAKRTTTRIFEEALAYYHFKQVPEARRLLEICLEAHPDDLPVRVYLERCAEYLRTGRHEGTAEAELVPRWTPELSVGHQLIDEQHQELFSRTGQLVEAVRHSGRQDEVPRLVSFLNEYVLTHFETEEKLMEERGYPFLGLQKEQHAGFVRGFTRLKEEIRERSDSPLYLTFRIQILLVDWLVNHTAKEDKHFGRFLQAQELPA